MSVTVFGIIVFWQPISRVFEAVSIIALQLFRESYTVFLLQPPKALEPMLVTLFGIMMEVSPLQLEKASLPMFVTPFGMETEVRPLQP